MIRTWTNSPALEAFLGSVRTRGVTALLLGGDLSNVLHLTAHLGALLDATTPGPVRLVMSNHDFYGDSLAAVRQRVVA